MGLVCLYQGAPKNVLAKPGVTYWPRTWLTSLANFSLPPAPLVFPPKAPGCILYGLLGLVWES